MSPYAEPGRFRVRALDLQARIMRNLARRHVQHICPAQTVGHQVVPHATYPMGDPTSYKRALSGQSDEPCFPYQARGGHRGDAAGTPWRLRHSCHPTQLASQLERPSRRNSVHEWHKTAPRGHFRQSVYTPASPTHARSRDRVGLGAPRHRRPHGPRDARAIGPEAHAAGAVTQPPTYTNSRSLLVGAANCRATPSCGKAIWQLIQPDLIVLSRHEQSRRINEVEKTSRELDLTGARELASVLSGGERQHC